MQVEIQPSLHHLSGLEWYAPARSMRDVVLGNIDFVTILTVIDMIGNVFQTFDFVWLYNIKGFTSTIYKAWQIAKSFSCFFVEKVLISLTVWLDSIIFF